MKKIQVARISTVKFFIYTQLKVQLESVRALGVEVTIVANDDKLSGNYGDFFEKYNYIKVNIPRKISLLKDLSALIRLIFIFKRGRFDIIHSTTPKAGLLCSIAGKLSGVDVRLHTFTGQPWVSMSGFKRYLLKSCDKVIGKLNTHCYVDSFSQRQFLIENNVVDESLISVLGKGSLAGVDLNRFNTNRYSLVDKNTLRKDLGIPVDADIILFVGRITKDKGIYELLTAFQSILSSRPNTFLLLVGPFEVDGEILVDVNCNERAKANLKIVGFSNEPEKYMSIATLLCLPSYREGFGTVIIEAAAMGLISIGSDIYGLSDSIVHDETGVLVPVKDHIKLSEEMYRLLDDEKTRTTMSISAKERAFKSFDSQLISDLLFQEYISLKNKI